MEWAVSSRPLCQGMGVLINEMNNSIVSSITFNKLLLFILRK